MIFSLLTEVDVYYESKVQIPIIKINKRQTIETLINEEALQFSSYLRDEINTWSSRIVSLAH
jgi:hypothetical protein